MRHRWSGRKLGRDSAHRKALLRNMVTEFLDKGRIITTMPKAKELRPFAEKLISLGKRESLHARRRALRIIRRKSVVHKLFDTLAPRYADRHGGYTRIVRLGFRKGDSAEMALIELVESETQESSADKKESKSEKAAAEAADKDDSSKKKRKKKND
jgi:large subunit ribosomal protein L17